MIIPSVLKNSFRISQLVLRILFSYLIRSDFIICMISDLSYDPVSGHQ